jgi:non-ribosomal peptide synthetase component F
MPLDIPLPHDRPPSPTGSKSTSAVDFSIPADVTAAITDLCRRSRSTTYILTVAAVQALVALYTGRSDIVLLTTVNRRDRPELQGVVGPIANGALLRSDLSGDPSFAEVVRRARAAVLAMFEHKHLPLEHIVDQLRAHLLAAGVEQHPQVPVSVEFFQVPTGPSPSDRPLDGGPPAAERHVSAGSTDVKDIFNPLAIRLFADDDRLWGRLAYHDAVFDRATAERLVAELKALLEAVAHDETLRLSELPPVSSAQRYARAWSS